MDDFFNSYNSQYVGGIQHMDKINILNIAIDKYKLTGLFNDKIYSYILDMFNPNNNYDMTPKILILDKNACLYTCERGERIYVYRTLEEKDVIYYILKYAIELSAQQYIYNKYKDDKGELHYSETIHNENNAMIADAFQRIGGNYEKWFMQKRSELNMEC